MLNKAVKSYVISLLSLVLLLTSCSNLFTPFSYAASSDNQSIITDAILPPGVTLDPDHNQEPVLDPPQIVEWEDPSVTEDAYNLSASLSTSLGIQSFTDELKVLSLDGTSDEQKSEIQQEDEFPVPFVPNFLLSDKDVGELMLAGAGGYDRYQIHLLASQQNINPLDIWQQKKESGLSWKSWLPQSGLKLADSNTVSQNVYGVFPGEALQDSSVIPSLSVSDEKETAQQDTYGLETSLSARSFISTMAVSSSDEATVNNFQKNMNSYLKLISPLQINQIYKEQYSDRQKTSESIDPATGALTWKFNALHYPGRDGLDMDLGLMYQSNQATSFLEANALMPVIVYRNGTTSLQYKNIAKSEWASENYLFNTFQLGNGWSFQLPSLQIERPRYGQETYYYYHNGGGASYQVKFGESATNLVNPPNTMTRFMRGGSFSNGQTNAAYYMEYPDKKREYFNDQGQLIGVVDRFQNKITYEYGGKPLQYIQITDTVGRKLRIEYQRGDTENAVTVYSITPDGQKKAEVVLKGQPQKWQARDRGDTLRQKNDYIQDVNPALRTLSYVHDDDSGKRQYLWTAKFNYMDRVRTEFSYTSRNWNTQEGVGAMAAFPLSEIEYPRSQTYYDYTRVVHNMGRDGLQQEFVVSQRADEPQKKDGSKRTNLVNQIQYTYSGDYTGFPQATSQENMPTGYTYEQQALTMEQGNQTFRTLTRFNYKGQTQDVLRYGAEGQSSLTAYEAYDSNFKFKPTRSKETIIDSAGQTTRYTEQKYDANGNLVQQTTPLTTDQLANADTKQKRSTFYTYEPQYNQIQTMTAYQNDSTQLTNTYAYTTDGRVSMVRDALGQEVNTTYTKTADGKVSQIVTERPVKAGVKARTVTNYGADTGYTLPSSVTTYFRSASDGNQLQNTQSFRYDPRTSLVLEATNGEGKKTNYIYDSLDRLIREQKPALTNTDGEVYTVANRYQYEDGYVDRQDGSPVIAGLVVSSYQETNQKSNGMQVNLNEHIATYDGFGMTLTDSSIDRSDPAVPVTKIIRYRTDSKMRPVKQTTAIYRGTAATGLQLMEGPITDVTIDYDSWDQLVTTIDAQGNQTKIKSLPSQFKNSLTFQDGNGKVINAVDQQYDQWGNLVQTLAYQDAGNRANPIRATYTYDIVGNMLTYTDPETNGSAQHARNREGVTQSYKYDRLNRPVQLLNAINQTANYEYDGNNQLIKASVQDATGTAVIFSKDFNETSLTLSKTDPSNNSDQNQYDTMGRLKVAIDRNGVHSDYTYDEWGQLKTVSKVDSSSNFLKYTYTYGKGNIQTNQLRVESLSSVNTMDQQMKTDLLGRVIQQSARTVNDATNPAYVGGMSMTYNGQGQVATMQTNYQSGTDEVKGTSQNYAYDNKQQLTNITLGSSNQNIKYAYTSQGKIESITYPTMKNGKVMKSSYTYDAINHMTQMITTLDDAVIAASNYLYDRNGNVLQSIEKRSGKTDHTINYTYDSLNRLIGVTDSVRGTTVYAYDLRGNRLIQTEDTPSVMIEPRDTTYLYDLDNQLKQYRSMKTENIPQQAGQLKGTFTYFSYLPNGMRYQKKYVESKVGLTEVKAIRNYISNGSGKVIFEALTNFITTGKPDKPIYTEYIRGDRVLLKKQLGSEKLYYYLYNGHGDVIGILNDDGSIANTYDYDEFGNLTQQEEQTDNSFKYAGEYQDAETGLYYLNARYYDPSMGRFINEDTYEGQSNNPLSQNVYTYVQNNPLIYVDPTGHETGAVTYETSNALRQDVVNAVRFGGIIKPALDFLILDDLATLRDPNASEWSKAFAAFGLIPVGKVLKGGKLIISLVDDSGKIVKRDYTLTGEALKLAKTCYCFTAGTKVKTDSGEKPIEKIEIGDKVLAKSDQTGEIAYKKVTGLFKKQADEIYYIHIKDEVIEVTGKHPFWLDGKGWTLVKDLKVGDLLVSSNGSKLGIDKIEKEKREATVYNFEVEDFNSYFVSNLGVWVHNCTINSVNKLLSQMPEFTGSTRDKLLAATQNQKLKNTIGELYRETATYGDGGTAAIVTKEFYDGSSKHLAKAKERLSNLNDLLKSGKLGLNDSDIADALKEDLERAINLYK